MSKLPLTFACGPYDRMAGLFDGSVPIEGVDLRPLVIEQPMEVFSRMLKHAEFDVAEMSLAHCFILRATQAAGFVTLPVFPSRMFRHGCIFVNRQAVASPKDLAGKRIGVQGYQMTAAVWIRGLLRDQGVALEDVTWLEGGVNEYGVAGGAATSLRPATPLDISPIGRDRRLSDMLAAGEIDALIGAITPDSFGKSPDVVRLYPNFHVSERLYYEQTRIFPIMHALVIRNDIYRDNPWVATSLFKACEAAKLKAQRQARFSGALRFMLPWLAEHLEELDQVFGPDPWPYGLAANRAALDAFGRYLVDDGFYPAALPLDEAFVPIAGGGR
jgi:4,5-dihydroxyphthalate decarboxylase